MKRFFFLILILPLLFLLCGASPSSNYFATKYPRVGYLQDNLITYVCGTDVSDTSTWADRSPQGDHFEQTTLSNQPDIDGDSGIGFLARDFDGVNDKMTLTDTDTSSDPTSLTILVWVKFENFSNDIGAIISKTDAGSAGGWGVEKDSGSNILKFWVRDASGWNGPTTGTLNADQWYFVGVTTNGSTASIYVDMILANSLARGDIVNTSGNITIGRNAAIEDASRYFTGSITQISIFNKALSEAEMQYIYNVDTGPNGGFQRQ